MRLKCDGKRYLNAEKQNNGNLRIALHALGFIG